MTKLGIVTLEDGKKEWFRQFETYPDLDVTSQESFIEPNECDAYFILGGESQLADICNHCVKIAKQLLCPVWIYKENCSKNDRLLFYNLGAMNVFSGKESPEEIVKAIHNGLKLIKKNKDKKDKKKIESNKNVKFVTENLCVYFDDKKPIYLTKLEYKALYILYAASPKAVSYKEIYERLWNEPYNKDNYKIANIIFHVREKLEKNVNAPKIVKTVRSNGYLFNYEYK